MSDDVRNFISKEFDKFIEYPTESKAFVSSSSTKFFAEHIYASQQARIDALEAKLLELQESYLLRVIADIRDASGLGDKPMLSELADAIKAKLAEVSKDD